MSTIFGLLNHLTDTPSVGIREWYEDDTILVDKDGLSGTVTNVGTGPFNENTILVDKDGLSGTTTEIPA